MLIGVMIAAQVALATAPAEAGKIILYRPQAITGAAIGCPVRYKGREIVELGRGKFAIWPVSVGRYILTNKTSSVEVTVDPGETRYIRCSMKAGFLTSRADLQIVDQESFEEHSKNFEEKPIEDVQQ